MSKPEHFIWYPNLNPKQKKLELKLNRDIKILERLLIWVCPDNRIRSILSVTRNVTRNIQPYIEREREREILKGWKAFNFLFFFLIWFRGWDRAMCLFVWNQYIRKKKEWKCVKRSLWYMQEWRSVHPSLLARV